MEAPVLAPGPLHDLDPLSEAIHDHAPGLWRYLRLLGCPAHQVEDLCQETFVIALEKGLGDRDRRQTGAFLRRIATHLHLRLRRGDRRREQLLSAATEQLWQRYCEDDGGSALMDALRECVDVLPERSRRAIDLAYRDGLDRRGIGAELGLAESGVKSLMQRVRRGLRRCVEGRIQR